MYTYRFSIKNDKAVIKISNTDNERQILKTVDVKRVFTKYNNKSVRHNEYMFTNRLIVNLPDIFSYRFYHTTISDIKVINNIPLILIQQYNEYFMCVANELETGNVMLRQIINVQPSVMNKFKKYVNVKKYCENRLDKFAFISFDNPDKNKTINDILKCKTLDDYYTIKSFVNLNELKFLVDHKSQLIKRLKRISDKYSDGVIFKYGYHAKERINKIVKNKINFGVEIEFNGCENPFEFCPKCFVKQFNKNAVFERDGSIDNGGEIITRVTRKGDDKFIKDILDVLKEHKCTTKDCGTHFHMTYETKKHIIDTQKTIENLFNDYLDNKEEWHTSCHRLPNRYVKENLKLGPKLYTDDHYYMFNDRKDHIELRLPKLKYYTWQHYVKLRNFLCDKFAKCLVLRKK